MTDEDTRMLRSCGNIFRDLGFGDEEAENLRIRLLLMIETENDIRRQDGALQKPRTENPEPSAHNP